VYFTLARIRLNISLKHILGFLSGIFPDFLLQLLAADVATVLSSKAFGTVERLQQTGNDFDAK
jgi:hypothetical protein